MKEPDWVGIGYTTADGGAVLLLVTLIVAGVASTKGKPGLAKAAAVLAAAVLAGWLVAAWAMGQADVPLPGSVVSGGARFIGKLWTSPLV